MPRLGVRDPAQHFLEHGVALSPGAQFGAPQFARLNFGTSAELVAEAVRRIARCARRRPRGICGLERLDRKRCESSGRGPTVVAPMPRPSTLFACTACGTTAPRWMGRCPGCGEWNTLVVTMKADTMTVKLNGVTVSKATDLGVTKGKLQFQSEGSEILFKKILLTPLD